MRDAVGPVSDPKAIPPVIVDLVREWFAVDCCFYLLFGEKVNVVVHSGRNLPQLEDVSDEAIRRLSTELLRVSDVQSQGMTDEVLRVWCVQSRIAALLSVPVPGANGAPAALCVAQRSPRRWTEDERLRLREVAAYTQEMMARRVAEQALRKWETDRSDVPQSAQREPHRLSPAAKVPGRRQERGTATESDHRFGTFLAQLVHELRDPLTPIVGALQLAEQVSGAKEQARLRRMVARQMEKLIGQVNDLGDLVRILRRELPLDRKHVDLLTAVRSASEAVQPLGQEANVPVDVRFPDQPLYIHADYAWIVRAFATLLEASLRTGSAPVTISVRVAHRMNCAIVRIRNTGPGIPAADISQVFTFFAGGAFRREGPRPGYDSGLGTAKVLLEMHGGTIRAYPAGRGIAFLVSLPLIPTDTARSSL